MEEKNRTFIFGTKEETARVAGSEESIPAAVGLIHENDWTVEEEASAKRK
jgi:hypothetical protein